jgi:hypothetical protein
MRLKIFNYFFWFICSRISSFLLFLVIEADMMKEYLIYFVFVLQSSLSLFKIYSHGFVLDHNNSSNNQSDLDFVTENLIATRNFATNLNSTLEIVTGNNISQQFNLNFVFQNVTKSIGNNCSNSTNIGSTRALWLNTVICFVFFAFILFTVIGNTLVILAVVIVKKLHRKDNYLIVSLAISDVLVGLIVMPFAMITEITDGNK